MVPTEIERLKNVHVQILNGECLENVNNMWMLTNNMWNVSECGPTIDCKK